MPNKKDNEFENWDPEYDIPDDPKPESKIGLNEIEEEYYHKKNMIMKLTDLREQALSLRKKQNDYWDSYGDNYRLEEIPLFVLKNKKEIAGVVKDAPWILSANIDEWEEDFRLYYGVLIRFIKVSQYAIASYSKYLSKI